VAQRYRVIQWGGLSPRTAGSVAAARLSVKSSDIVCFHCSMATRRSPSIVFVSRARDPCRNDSCNRARLSWLSASSSPAPPAKSIFRIQRGKSMSKPCLSDFRDKNIVPYLCKPQAQPATAAIVSPRAPYSARCPARDGSSLCDTGAHNYSASRLALSIVGVVAGGLRALFCHTVNCLI
jgi:hypothetical protein